jgi:Reverse transcriptase (RNA-dependent DNA polymerase)
MRATHEAELDIPTLPKAARHIFIVPELADKTLLSVSQLCQAGCQVIFHDKAVTVHYGGKVVLKGAMTARSALWQMEVPTEKETEIYYTANAAIHFNTAAEIVKFMHAAMGYPVLATLHKALTNGWTKGFPGLTPQTLQAHPPFSDATIKGHMAQTRKNEKSTKPAQQKCEGEVGKPHSQNEKNPNKAHSVTSEMPTKHHTVQFERANSTDLSPNQSEPKHSEVHSAPRKMPTIQIERAHSERPNDTQTEQNSEKGKHADSDEADTEPGDNDGPKRCYAAIFRPTKRSYSDQTGEFVCQSTAKNKYVYILYDQTSNHIFAEPIQSTSDADITKAFEKVIGMLQKAGINPDLHMLDNQCGKLQIAALERLGIKHQVVPPGMHRRNAAERAIQTFKDHFISILCGTDDTFPLKIWDKLIPQAVLTLNLMRGSRMNSKHSAHSQIHRPFDYNATPIAPLGFRVLVHVKPHMRGTWDPKAEDGFYIGQAPKHYRCVTVYIKETASTRITDTIAWIPQNTGVPTTSPSDKVIAAIQNVQTTIMGIPKSNSLADRTEEKIQTLQHLTELFASDKDNAGKMRVAAATVPEVPENNAGKLRVASNTAIPTHLPPLPTEPTVRPQGPTPTMPSTYKQLTGTTGAKYRRTERRKHIPVKLREDHATHVWHIIRASAETDAEFLAYYGHAVNPDTKKLAEYHELLRSSDAPKWIEGMEDEWGRLIEGNEHMETGTKTLRFINRDEIPDGYIPTYWRIVVAYRPEKEKPYRVRVTVGGDRVIFNGEVSTKAADLATVKIPLNSVISTPGARFMTLDIKDFYLNTLMKFEDRVYMRIPERAIPESIKARYNVQIYNGVAYVEVTKGMYGLKQAGRLANERLTEFLAPFGYAPCQVTPGLWKHATRTIVFTLVVDDFGIRYINDDDRNHLVGVLRKKYKISEDLTGNKYCGLHIDWDYENGTCDISMPGYIERALEQFAHKYDGKPEKAPEPYDPIDYGAKIQYAIQPDTTPLLDAGQKKRIQEILGVLLYYARAIDSTLLVALGALASEQATATEMTVQRITHLLNYCASNPEASIRFIKSDMVLHVESDASYLSLPKATSRVGGYHYLSSKSSKPGVAPTHDKPMPPMNGAINVVCNILRVVVSSASEAEMAGLFHNAKEACALRTALTEMGHEQPPTPIVTDNSTAAGIANNTVKQKQSKSMDMHFYWIRDRTKRGEFCTFWRKGILNRADYFTKKHPPKHHEEQRSTYIHQAHHTYEDEIAQQHYSMSASGDTTSEFNHMELFHATFATTGMT